MPWAKDDPKIRGQCEAILTELRENNPGVRLARSKTYCAVGLWNDKLQNFQPIYSYAITGHWVDTTGRYPLINGEPAYKPADWQE